jgi:hypothetical protein
MFHIGRRVTAGVAALQPPDAVETDLAAYRELTAVHQPCRASVSLGESSFGDVSMRWGECGADTQSPRGSARDALGSLRLVHRGPRHRDLKEAKALLDELSR